MSGVGRGALGLVDQQRTFYDHVEESSVERRMLLEYVPGVEVLTRWDSHLGGTYKRIARYRLDDVVRDIVAVDTSLGPLARVETLAECESTSGTYYYDIDEANNSFTPPPLWDGEVNWDTGGQWWDLYEPGPLYVHLSDNSHPDAAAVVLGLGFYYSTRGEVHPSRGAELFTDGEFEVWTSSTDLTHWTESSDAGWTVNQEAAVVRSGTYAARLEAVAAADTTSRTVRQNRACVVGKVYCFSGYYLTEPRSLLNAKIRIRDTGSTAFIDVDGRSVWSSINQVTLRPTGGVWRRFTFYFLAFATTMVPMVMAANDSGGAASGKVYFDGVSFRRVYGFWFHEPRLGAASVPDTESGKAAVFFGGKAISLGQVGLLNGDGHLDATYGQLLLLNRPAALYDGGGFLDGEQLPREEWRPGFLGYTRDVEAGDEAVRLSLEDQWTFSQEPLPARVYSRSEFAGLRGDADGRARPLLFGRRIFYAEEGDTFAMIGPIQPVRIGLTANGYGVYEICDPTNAPGPLEPFPGA